MELKCPLTIEEQLNKLASHGVEMEDREEAERLLKQVSYYRLTGYTLQFRKNPTSSDLESSHSMTEIRKIYEFDSKLRSILRHYIEINEVFYKTHISNIFSLEKCTKPQHDDSKTPQTELCWKNAPMGNV